MVELKLKKTLLRLDFSFFAVIALFLIMDSSGFGIAALAACGLHEMSHLAIMTAFGISADSITFYGAGIRISSEQTDRVKPPIRAAILLGGCAANFTAAAVFRFLGNDAAAAINLFKGIFNLLPLGELDGAALFKMLAIRVCRPENVDRAVKAASVISAAIIALTAAAFSGEISFTLITTALYIIIVSTQ